jgi:Cys-rich protein (TIGR01571 family)
MICLLCHILFGASYRAEIGVKYRVDVCRSSTIVPLNLRAKDFDTGLFDCLQGKGVLKRSFMACCCTPVYFAVDASATDFMDFWMALVLSSIFIPFIWLFGLFGRLNIRRVFQMNKAFCGDLLSWFCCFSCALIQEHRFMNRAFQAHYDHKRDFEILPLEQLDAAKQVTPSIPQTPPTAPPTPAGASSSV